MRGGAACVCFFFGFEPTPLPLATTAHGTRAHAPHTVPGRRSAADTSSPSVSPPLARAARAHYESGIDRREEEQAQDHQPFASSSRTKPTHAWDACNQSLSEIQKQRSLNECEHRSGGPTSTLLVLLLVLLLSLVLVQSDAANGSRDGPTFDGGLFGLFCQYTTGIQRR